MGTLSGYKPNRLATCLENKLEISFGSGSELKGWYWLDGKKTFRVVIPKGHGSQEVSPRVMNRVIGNLRLSKEEIRQLYECPMTGSDYERKIRLLVEPRISGPNTSTSR